jgi:DUF4097 and DUF4098 domain-containing protein YvlB
MRTETFATPGAVELTINVPAGHVEIEAVETAETTVELEARGRDADEYEREAVIEARPRGSGHEVVVDASARRGLLGFREGEYRVRITTPAGANVRAELASADISGRGHFGALEVNAASGDVVFDEIEDHAKVNTASGDVELRRVGSAKVNSASGDVRINESGPVEANTASGDVVLRSVSSGEVKVHSASGDVEVGIAKGSRLWVDAQSLSGDTSSELELESGAPAEGDEGPLVELRAQTMSGDISVRRA